ncbi:MAG: hypothetical protein ABI460_11795 [Caldimonas sp.]
MTLMPYPNDRRKKAYELDDEALSPEYLAMLVACGGEVRTADRAALREAETERRYGRRKDDFVAPPGGVERRS